MPGKKKRRFTAKGDRMAGHVAESMKKKGTSPKEAERIGYATAQKSGAPGIKPAPGMKTKKGKSKSNKRPRNKGRS